MAKLSLLKGVTSQTIQVCIQDSTSTTGTGKTGLVFNTASLTCYYVRPRSAPVAVTLATQTVTGAYSSGGFVEIDAVNLPGWYRLDVPDAALATGVECVGMHLRGATGMAPLPLEIELVDFSFHGQSAQDLRDFADDAYDPSTNKLQGVLITDTLTTYTGNTPQTGDNFARIGALGAGLTALASQTSLNTVDDFLDTEVAAILAAVDTEVGAIKAVTDALPNAGALTTIQADLDNIQTRLPTTLVAGRIDASVGAMAADVLTATAIAADAITAAKIAAGAIDAATFAAGAIDAAAIAANAIGASELAADAVAEIQSGLATAAALATLQTDTDDIQARLPVALVGGRMDSAMQAAATGVIVAATFAAGAIDAAAIAANAIGASELAADAVTEIQSGLATAAALALLNNVSVAQIATEIADALAVDTYVELTAVPAATSSLATKISWLFLLARNEMRQTATAQTVRNDANTLTVGTSIVSDNAVTTVRGTFG